MVSIIPWLTFCVFPFSSSLMEAMFAMYSSCDWAPMQGPLQFLMWYSRQTRNLFAWMFSGVSTRWQVRSG